MKHATQIHDRRAFLKTLGVLAAGAALAPAIRVLPAFAASGVIKTSEQRMLMGTFVSMTVLAPSQGLGEEAIGRAFAEIEAAFAEGIGFDAVTVLNEPAEHQVALLLSRFGEVVAAVGETLQPHRLCGYLYELAGALSSFYEQCPVLRSEGEVLGIAGVEGNGQRELVEGLIGLRTADTGRIVLKVAQAAWDGLQFDRLWNRSAHPPAFCWV